MPVHRAFRVCVAPLACVALLFLVSTPTNAQGDAPGAETAFVTGTEDLPLMAGLIEVVEAGLAFDTPGGRIVEAYATGPVSAADVEAFYTATLPQLGWTGLGNLAFTREDEVLRIALRSADETLTVEFLISPRPRDP